MVGNGIPAVLFAGVALVGVTACGSGELQIADGAPPSEPTVTATPSGLPTPSFSPFDARSVHLNCPGQFASSGSPDYALAIGPNGKPVYAPNPNTPRSLAERRAKRAADNVMGWDRADPPDLVLTEGRGKHGSRVARADFRTSGGELLAVLLMDWGTGPGRRMGEMSQCAYGPGDPRPSQ